MNDADVQVRPAEWPRDHAAAYDLLERYFADLRSNSSVPASIRNTDRRPELESLAQAYQDETAELFLAWSEGQACGCVTVRTLATIDGAAEMKRLYVLPQARRKGAGIVLIEACAVWARQHGARDLLLDTLPAAMPGAIRLYVSAGFVPTDRYNQNIGPDFAFYRRGLL